MLSSQYVVFIWRKLDEEDAESRLKEQDDNSDGKVSWAEYLKTVYDFTPQQVVDMKEDKNSEVRKYADVSYVDINNF